MKKRRLLKYCIKNNWKQKIFIIKLPGPTFIFQIRIMTCNSLWLTHHRDYSHDSLINTPDHSWDITKILQTFYFWSFEHDWPVLHPEETWGHWFQLGGLGRSLTQGSKDSIKIYPGFKCILLILCKILWYAFTNFLFVTFFQWRCCVILHLKKCVFHLS